MRPRTKLNRIRFTDEERAGLDILAEKLGVPKAAIVRAFVRIGIRKTAKPDLAELSLLIRTDGVKRGRALGYSKAAEKVGGGVIERALEVLA